jgi:hypothetical protein
MYQGGRISIRWGSAMAMLLEESPPKISKWDPVQAASAPFRAPVLL